jgi:hypothetical protein
LERPRRPRRVSQLQEREPHENASLAAAIATALQRRNGPGSTASLIAQVVLAVFDAAYGDWVDDTAADLAVIM